MARTTATNGSWGSAVASSVTAVTIQALGPGVGFAVLSAAAPTEAVGAVGFRLHPDAGIALSGLDGTKDLYVGALVDDVDFEYEAT